MEKFMKYGTDPVLDELVNSSIWTNRLKAAKIGYGLDELVYDENIEVLEAVAEQGYGFEELLKYNRDIKPAIHKYLKEHKITLKDWFCKNNLDYDKYIEEMTNNGAIGVEDLLYFK